MKALVIAPQPFFSPRGTPFSVYYRTLIMAELGVQVDLLTYGEGQDVSIPNVRIIRTPRFAWLGNVKTGPSALKLFLDAFLFVWMFALLCRRRYDFVHAHEEAVFFARLLKPIFRFKLVYDMHSSLPQQLLNFSFTESRLLIGLFEKLENNSIRAADAIITICPALRDYVNEQIGPDPRHILIENSIFDDVRLADGVAGGAGSACEAHGIPPSLAPMRKIVYAGTLEAYQGIDTLLEAFARVAAGTPDVCLLIAGGEPRQVREFSAQAAKLGIEDRCHFFGRVPQRAAKALNAQADVIVSPRSSGTNTPLKIYEQLASGTPIVATNIHSHTQILSDDVAFLVEPDPAAMAAGLQHPLSDPGLAQRKALAARRLYETEYSRPVYKAKMQTLLGLVR